MSDDFEQRLAAIREQIDGLDDIREQIDGLDDNILQLINQRAACAQEVAQIKRATVGETHFYRPEREAQVLRRVLANSKGPLDSEEMARLFRRWHACSARSCRPAWHSRNR
jgi:chorismate mutase-like protein